MNNKTNRTTPSVAVKGRRAVAAWRHYSRKGYAMFQSIGREFTIGVLGVAMLSTQQVTATNATGTSTHRPTSDEQVADSTALDEVTVTGTMTSLAAIQQARIVSVITREDIARAAAPTVNDLLKSVAGVDVRQRGGFSIQTDISIDGGTFDQVTILLNGINITNPQTGHHTMDLPVNPHDIERIEILEGAAGRVYGGAFGGAINIITRTPPRPSPQREDNPTPALPSREGALWSLSTAAHGGSWGTMGGDASVSLATRHTSHTLTGGAERSDGGMPNSDFRRTNLFYQGRWYSNITDKGVNNTPSLEGRVGVGLQLGLSQKQYGANTFYSPKFPDQWEGNRRFFAALSADVAIRRTHLRPTVHWNRAYDHFQLMRGTDKGENHHRTDVFGGSLTADRRWWAGKTAVGLSIRHERISSTNLGRPKAAVSVHDGFTVGLYTHADHRTQYDANIEHNILLTHWTVSAGVLASRNTAIDRRWRLYPGIDVAFRPDAHWRVFASYNRGFRMPTFTDLYYSGAERQGNGNLLPEETHCVSLGTSYRTSWSSATARLFYHRGRHMIDWVKYSAADPVYYAADFDLDNLGAQIKVEFCFGVVRGVKGVIGASRLEVKDDTIGSQKYRLASCARDNSFNFFNSIKLGLSYTFIHQRRHDLSPVYKSSYAGEYLRHKFTAALSHSICGPLSMQWNVRVCDRVGSYELYENQQPTGTLHPCRPYAVFDAKIQCPLRHFTLWLSGENLTNHRYYDLGNIPQPGLCLLAGVRWTM